jgi:hypothetical protein
MLNTTVLVLNRSYLPIHVTSVRRAFTLIYQGTALAVNGEYRTFDFDGWSQLPPDPDRIGTPRGPLRVPRVITLCGYDRVPRRWSEPASLPAESGPCDSPIAGGANDLGERGVQLRRLQSAQGRADARPGAVAPAAVSGTTALDADDASRRLYGEARRVAPVPSHRRIGPAQSLEEGNETAGGIS